MIYSKKTFSEGFFEIRCKLSAGHGAHSAFWLLGGFLNLGTYNEIDIMEGMNLLPSGIQKIGTNFHIDSLDSNINFKDYPELAIDINKFTETFHTFGLMLTKDKITWYWNNKEIRQE